MGMTVLVIEKTSVVKVASMAAVVVEDSGGSYNEFW